MEIICDKCGAVIPNPEWKVIRDGEIEHTHMDRYNIALVENDGGSINLRETMISLRQKMQGLVH